MNDDEETSFCTCWLHPGKRKLPRSEFRARPDRCGGDGVHSWCRACEAEAARRRRAHRKLIDFRSRWTGYGLHLREDEGK